MNSMLENTRKKIESEKSDKIGNLFDQAKKSAGWMPWH